MNNQNQVNNTVRKFHNLLSSGAVTVTGPTRQRIFKQKSTMSPVPSNTSANGGGVSMITSGKRCYVCDDVLGNNQAQHQLVEMATSHTSTKFPNKIGQLVGEQFMVIISVEDVICTRCSNLLNYLDRLESDVDRVRSNLLNILNKKYGLNDDIGGGVTPPPNKIQKLNNAGTTVAIHNSDDGARKIMQHTTEVNDVKSAISPATNSVQLKVPHQTTITNVQQQTSGTQTLQRKTTRIYKCLSCDYRTSDMRLFNTHYETCKQQNFQCKNCKKIFPNFGSMKQHMIREHNTAMENTCSVCHIHFLTDSTLRKHMETTHSTNVLVTSTTTLPAVPVMTGAVATVGNEALAIPTNASSSPLYTCSLCSFKTTDKIKFDEHSRRHVAGVKSKPFKCRLCAQRFETREAATTHAKQHQANFKCGTCGVPFPKREMLVKHFELNHSKASQQKTANQAQSAALGQNTTTQKLLQDTIDEALSDNVGNPMASTVQSTEASTTAASSPSSVSAGDYQFLSCNICSLTFLQESYYNTHMATHDHEKKNATNSSTGVGSATELRHGTGLTSLSNAALLNNNDNFDKIVGSTCGDTDAQQSAGNAGGGISEADIESIFEKIHADKSDGSPISEVTSAGTVGNVNNTNHSNDYGLSFNISIPTSETGSKHEHINKDGSSGGSASVNIDMPMLDQSEEAIAPHNSSGKPNQLERKADATITNASIGPVSMPSLDDDNDMQLQAHLSSKTNSESSQKTEVNLSNHIKESKQANTAENGSMQHNAETAEPKNQAGEEENNEQLMTEVDEEEQRVRMQLDEAMQGECVGGQIKFILNENGQILQLDDNHIITDADGNQILVQDSEQIQQLLQSCGVLQAGEGLDGETLQMMTDGNGQMVLVQGENNEAQLIDASLLNSEGQLVIQQGADGELGEGAHVIGEDGTRIPVSVSYTEDGRPIVQVQQQHLNEAGDVVTSTAVLTEKDEAVTVTAAQGDVTQNTDEAVSVANKNAPENTATTASTTENGNASGFFALEELMQQSAEEKSAAE